MVRHQQQLKHSGVSDERVLRAVEAVHRERFVPDDMDDGEVDDGVSTSVVAKMTEALRPQPEHCVLEVGAGSGYQAAILAELVSKVYSIEIDPKQADEARERLNSLGYRDVELRTGDGHDGWIEKAPFDAIIVTAAAEDVPHPLMDQLKDGGRMVIPIGTPFGPQELILIEKHGRDVTTRTLMPVRFVSFRRSLA